ncbi:MAG TPA: class I SAM-dependent methyltransferase [Bryobacteraceae bacterium]|nr:class I SAM-dependent methyltransferase [Bryobacteraceae bacterium]
MGVAAARQKRVVDWYQNYYTSKGDDRNDPLRNPGVLFQNLAFEKSIVQALRVLPIEHSWKILDVGCGAGFSLLRLLTYGLEPERLYGIDISEDRIARGRKRFPALNLTHGDATKMDYPPNSFDLAMESTMFIQLTDESISQEIANEMVRVVKPGGYLMLTDWRYSFNRPGYQALSRKRLARLFGVGTRTTFVSQTRGALVPPLGRWLSRYFPSVYFPLCATFPALVGQVTVVLRKTD